MKKDELSMIEVAHAILEQKGDVMDFSELVEQIQKFLGTSAAKVKKILRNFIQI